MSNKPIIVFEGIECSGKSFHIQLIAKYLKKNKVDFVRIREPGGSFNSEKIRKLILSNKSNFNKNTDLLLYMASRSENIKTIKDNYKKKIILIDRFIDSTIAYQHYGLGVNLDIINFINNFLLNKIKINFTFLNTVNTKNLKIRLKKRKKLNRYDNFDEKFYANVQRGFLKLMKKKRRNNYIIVNSNLDINTNKKIVLDKLTSLIT